MKLNRLAAVTASAAIAALVPSSALAGTHTAPDATGDQWKTTETKHSWMEEVDPGNLNGDIDSSTVTHDRRTVTVSVHHRGLVQPTTENEGLYQFIDIRTNRGPRTFFVMADGTDPSGDVTSFGANKRCRGTSVSIDYGTATITTTIKRKCLKFPRWVRMGAQTGVGSGDGEYNSVSWLDDALSSDSEDAPWEAVVGPKVYRG